MKLSWLFGPTMEQRHLLYVYLSVWIIQGGYFLWIAWKWVQTKRQFPPALPPSHEPRIPL
jgi:hypothetical protein